MPAVDESPKPLVVPFNTHARVEVLEAALGTGRTRIGDFPELTNHFGTVHGGALFTVGEAASGFAFMGALYGASAERAPALIAVVKTATINFLKMAQGSIEAFATLETPIEQVFAAIAQSGRATATVKVILTNPGGVLVAEMIVQWHVRSRG